MRQLLPLAHCWQIQLFWLVFATVAASYFGLNTGMPQLFHPLLQQAEHFLTQPNFLWQLGIILLTSLLSGWLNQRLSRLLIDDGSRTSCAMSHCGGHNGFSSLFHWRYAGGWPLKS